MSDNIEQIKGELEALGYGTCLSDSPQGTVVSFLYTVETGSHKGRQVRLGVSMHGGQIYPEGPPHWIHLQPPIDDGKGGAVERYTDPTNGKEWIAMSRPPGELWDQLPTKHMRAYIDEHLRRFWNNI